MESYEFGHILLEKEQQDLLCVVAEAARNVPREKRRKFVVARSTKGDALLHEGLGDNLEIYFGDVEALAAEGLVSISYGSGGSPMFDITPLGYKYYEFLKNQIAQPAGRVVNELTNYIASDVFQTAYPQAFEKWAEAEHQLWADESNDSYTLIGHLCREAMQEFAEVLVTRHRPADAPDRKVQTVARIRAVLEHRARKLGNTERPFVDALLAYWGTVTDLTQRQEHGGERETEPLVWEDARRVVFQTLLVMYELDRAVG